MTNLFIEMQMIRGNYPAVRAQTLSHTRFIRITYIVRRKPVIVQKSSLQSDKQPQSGSSLSACALVCCHSLFAKFNFRAAPQPFQLVNQSPNWRDDVSLLSPLAP